MGKIKIGNGRYSEAPKDSPRPKSAEIEQPSIREMKCLL